MQVLTATGHKQMPWKNGKGITTEIAVHPACASVEDFDWRISTAAVVEDGAFSLFEGVDRTLSVLSGESLDLSVGEAEPVRLHKNSGPFRFPADVATRATLRAGAITDLNVMTRRGRWDHDVVRLTIDGKLSLASGSGIAVIIGHEGLVHVKDGDREQGLGPLDTVVADGGSLTLRSRGEASFFLVMLRSMS